MAWKQKTTVQYTTGNLYLYPIIQPSVFPHPHSISYSSLFLFSLRPTERHPTTCLSLTLSPSFDLSKLFLALLLFFVYRLSRYTILDMTITCHCTSQGCGEMGGRQLDPRTQKSHAYKDKARLVELASDAAEQAIEDQLETIRIHLASTTLADDVSSSTAVPGGRMWAYSQRESLPETIDISATYSPPRQDLICNLLSRLSEIESTVNALSQTVDSELQHLDAPLFVNSSSFPLHHLFLECHHLDADLFEKVKSKITSVTWIIDPISSIPTVWQTLATDKLEPSAKS